MGFLLLGFHALAIFFFFFCGHFCICTILQAAAMSYPVVTVERELLQDAFLITGPIVIVTCCLIIGTK